MTAPQPPAERSIVPARQLSGTRDDVLAQIDELIPGLFFLVVQPLVPHADGSGVRHLIARICPEALAMTLLSLFLSAAAFVYLVYAMLRPEKF